MKKKGKSKVKNKDLEKDITGKFMDVIHGLGHDAEKLKKEIAKAGKAVSKKITSALQLAKAKAESAEGAIDKPAKKAGKKAKAGKAEVAKTAPKAEKTVSKAGKAIGDKTNRISGLSVHKPALPAIDKTSVSSDKKEDIKEASEIAAARKRAPRRSKQEIEAAESTKKTPVKEASAAAPAKRKRAPAKPKLIATSEPANTEEAADKETAASTITD